MFISIKKKTKNDFKGPENVLQCEGGSYLDLQYEYKNLIHNFVEIISSYIFE